MPLAAALIVRDYQTGPKMLYVVRMHTLCMYVIVSYRYSWPDYFPSGRGDVLAGTVHRAKRRDKNFPSNILKQGQRDGGTEPPCRVTLHVLFRNGTDGTRGMIFYYIVHSW